MEAETIEMGNIIEAPSIKKVVMFKNGMAFYAMKSSVSSTVLLNLQFKAPEMDDILKSLFVADLSQNGFISNISYDAAQDVDQVLKNISVSLPSSRKLLEDFFASMKGASVHLSLPGKKEIEGSVIGIEGTEEIADQVLNQEPLLMLLDRGSNKISKIRFDDIKGFKLLNKDLQKDLEFLLETTISRKQKDVKNLAIRCEASTDARNETRDIYINYIQESPLWKTSYRLVLPGESEDSPIPEGKASLTGWGLVENQTPNDWNDVDLTLVAGMPVTFRYPIYMPQFIERKVVPLPTKTSVGPATIEDTLDLDRFADGEAKYDKTPMSMSIGSGTTMTTPAGPSKPREFDDTFRAMKDAMQKSISTSTKDMGELFEYHIGNPVSIKRNQSALVPFMSEEVTAKKVLLYDRAIHPMNPMACAEITNTSGLTLETGPITILIEDSLAGEAMLPFLNKDDTRMLNYTLEQAVVVFSEENTTYQRVHKVNIYGSYVYEYYYEDKHVIYTLKNKAKTKKTLYLDHEKLSGYDVLDPPVKPTETTNRWRFVIDLEPLDSQPFKFTMRREISSSVYLWDITASWITTKLAGYVKNKFVNDKARKVLEEIAGLNAQRADLEKHKNELVTERDTLNRDQDRLRENVKILGEGDMESSLKERLVQKLSAQENRYEEIKKEIESIEKKVEAINKKAESKFRNISV
jgi:hypothetical protein